MKVLLQRCSQAQVHVNGDSIAQIGRGLLLLVGIEKQDDLGRLEKAASKVLRYRVFPDAEGKMNQSVIDVGGSLLCVSQFTLAADTQKGLRPSFSSAAPPEQAETLYNHFVSLLRTELADVQTGQFGADMQVSLTNDGPVTFLLES
jgi:D-tyrosyl-tRNA(Tyr) deacylase